MKPFRSRGIKIFFLELVLYIALAIEQANMHAIGYAILAMFVVIALYDQLIFRPFISYSERVLKNRNEPRRRRKRILGTRYYPSHKVI